ncbi:hypothetical protein BD779DRAFT_1572158 [Infundibulicybe gibba]|nr:hypothetical protein BD779DRAFT_1572158 [Infundibulicybe gibba]
MTRSDQSKALIMRILPVEMIREIFLWCLPQAQYDTNQCQLPPAPMEPRLVLTHVCSTWREIAFCMPGMWTHILVDLEHPSLNIHGHSIISTWLSRSSPLPISLQIQHSPTYPTHLGTTEAELWQLLLLPAGTLFNLESIQLHGNAKLSEAGVDFLNQKRITAFQRCPKLHYAITNFRRLDLPWRQLTFLAVGHIGAIFCLDILQECVLLRECFLSICPIDGAAIDKLHALLKQPLQLPSLHSLSLVLVNHRALFIAALHMPNLRMFRPLGQWRMTDRDLEEFLHPLQHLTKLFISLSNSSLSAPWWQGLSSGTLIPSEIEAIILLLENRLVASRAAGGGVTMFTSVHSNSIRPTDLAVVSRLEALEAAGVRVEFNYAYYQGY